MSGMARKRKEGSVALLSRWQVGLRAAQTKPVDPAARRPQSKYSLVQCFGCLSQALRKTVVNQGGFQDTVQGGVEGHVAIEHDAA